MRLVSWSMAIALAATSLAQAQEGVRVKVEGRVDDPGERTLPLTARLADAVTSAHVRPDAYVVGAAWLRPELLDEQTRLKAGLQFELGVIERTAAVGRGKESLPDLVQRMHAWLDAMPVTGRQVVRTLEPHAIQIDRPDNLPVADGDRLYYPSRPVTVHIVGAVIGSCEVPQAGLKDVRDYAGQCARSRYADPDWVWVVEPDGSISERGIGLWNRSPATPVAPGAYLYVPLDRRAIADATDKEFNRDMARFLATQPTSGSGTMP